MRTPTELPILIALMQADTDLGTVLGTGADMNLYQDGERDLEIPSLLYFVVFERPEAEVFNEYWIQFTPFVRSEGDLQTIHSALYTLFHREAEWISGGITFRSQFVSAQKTPARAGVYSGPIEFSFKTVRSLYH